jgi:hypothetical protein
MPFPCLVDPERHLYRALGLGRFSWRAWLAPRTAAAYLGALAHGARQGWRTGDARQQGGVAVFDSALRLAWLHRSTTLGDYPGVERILGALEDARRAA